MKPTIPDSSCCAMWTGGDEVQAGPPAVAQALLESFGPGQTLMPACEPPVLCLLLANRSLLCYQFLAPPLSSSSSTALRLLRHTDGLLGFQGELPAHAMPESIMTRNWNPSSSSSLLMSQHGIFLLGCLVSLLKCIKWGEQQYASNCMRR